jgi:hypothetical protein
MQRWMSQRGKLHRVAFNGFLSLSPRFICWQSQKRVHIYRQVGIFIRSFVCFESISVLKKDALLTTERYFVLEYKKAAKLLIFKCHVVLCHGHLLQSASF